MSTPQTGDGRTSGTGGGTGGATGAATGADPAGSVTAPDRSDRDLLKLAAVMLVGAIAALLDTTIVNVAINTIGRDLHAPLTEVQWVLTGYLLSYGMVIPLSGWALARFGGRATWLTALSLFLAASVAAGASWNIGSLIAFRVLQGIGGGLLLPVLTTLLVQAAGGKPLGKLMATVSLPAVVVPILGPVIGGLIVSNLSWRWIFYVNVPIGLVGLALAWRGIPALDRDAQRARPRLDITGIALLSPSVALLLYGLAQVSTDDGFFRRGVLIPVAVGCVLLALYIVRALRPEGRVKSLIDLKLFRVRSFAAAASLMFISGLSMYGALLLLPLYYQEIRGASALGAGLLMAPQGIGALLPRTLAGRLTDRIGPRPVVLAGMAVAAAGTVPFALAGAHTSELLLSLVLVVRGAGLTTATIALMAGAFQGLPRASVPDAASATRIMQQVGGSFGAAVLAVILVGHSFDVAFWWSAAFTGVAMLPALLLPGRRRAELGRAVAWIAVAWVPVAWLAVAWLARAAGSNQRTEPAGPSRPTPCLPPRRRHADRPAGFGPYGAPGAGVGEAPPAGAGGHQGETPAAFGHWVWETRRRDRIAALIGDRDPGHPIARAVDLDDEHATVSRGGVRDRVRAELGHARHERFPRRAADQHLAGEPARLRHGRGRSPERARPRSRRPDRTSGPQRKHRVGTCHRRSPPEK
jgi:EmrB/QacA subfamily drug resistance transporter